MWVLGHSSAVFALLVSQDNSESSALSSAIHTLLPLPPQRLPDLSLFLWGRLTLEALALVLVSIQTLEMCAILATSLSS